MTSSEAPARSAYAFEQLDAGNLVRSRLDGSPIVGPGEERDAAERERSAALALAVADGRAVGLAEAREQATPLLSALAEALAGIEALRGEIAERVERDAVELAIALAERIVAGALDVAPERVLDVVRGALRRVTDRQRVTVIVNPEDAELVSAHLAELRGELGGIEEAQGRIVAIVRRLEEAGSLVIGRGDGDEAV